MAKPGTVPTTFASAATYDATSGVSVGLIGTPVRVAAPGSLYSFGFVPGGTLKSQWLNTVLGLTVDWVRWVADGTSTAATTAHLVETTASGRANVRHLHIGTSPIEPYFPAALLEVVGEVGYGGLSIDIGATGLQAFTITSASTGSGAASITQTGAGMPALTVIGPGGVGVAAIAVNGGSGTGVTATVTGANGSAIEGYATAGSVAGVYGEGASIGVKGATTANNGTGGLFETPGTATSSGKALLARAFADGTAIKAEAVDNNAITATCTGEQDAIVVFAAGDGAALRLDPQAEPVVERVGQVWFESINSDTNRAMPLCKTNDSGLSTVSSKFWLGPAPLIYATAKIDAVVNVLEGALLDEIMTIDVENPYDFAVTVWVRGTFTANVLAAGGIPLDAAIVPTLYNLTAASTIAGDTWAVSGGNGRMPYTIEGSTVLATTGNHTIKVYLSVNGAGAGSIDVRNRSLHVMTAAGGVA